MIKILVLILTGFILCSCIKDPHLRCPDGISIEPKFISDTKEIKTLDDFIINTDGLVFKASWDIGSEYKNGFLCDQPKIVWKKFNHDRR